MNRRRVPFIVGPTASGKTEVSLLLARRLPVEVVSADSRQIYRRMEIGTAKPTADERRLVRHHCIDLVDPDATFSAGQYVAFGRSAIKNILARGRIPCVTGGSGLYVRALVDGIFEGAFRDPALRESLNREAEEKGLEALHLRLGLADPDAAAKIHPNDRKRIVRALEVIALSGTTLSRLQRENTRPAEFQPVFYGLRWPREALAQRIERRVERMMEAGFLEEVRGLIDSGLTKADNAMDSVGYKELAMHLDGDIPLGEAIRRIKLHTRQFAKRQMTWFNADSRIQWLELGDATGLENAADRIVLDFLQSD